MNFAAQSARRGASARRVLLIACISAIIFLILGFFWATATPGKVWSDPPGDPEDSNLAASLEKHVTVLATTPRSLAKITDITRTQAYIESELTSIGFEFSRQDVVPPANNIITKISATKPNAPTLIIGAHYDTVSASPGADDNASGVAALLELARSLKGLEGKSAVHFELVFYANEEPPYFHTNAMGSFVHAQSIENPDQVIGMISLESMGYYSDVEGSQNYPFPLSMRYPSTGNFIAFVGDTSSRTFLRETIGEFRNHIKMPSVGGTAPGIVQGIHWSDHWAYSKAGIPAFMITDTAPFRNPNYHRSSDTPETLDYQRLALVVEALTKMCQTKATQEV